jgi:hypothetical protein
MVLIYDRRLTGTQNQSRHGGEVKNSQIYQAPTGKWVKLDLDTPSGFQEVQVSRISRTSAHESVKVVSHKHRPLLPSLPQDILLVLFLVEAESTPGP